MRVDCGAQERCDRARRRAGISRSPLPSCLTQPMALLRWGCHVICQRVMRWARIEVYSTVRVMPCRRPQREQRQHTAGRNVLLRTRSLHGAQSLSGALRWSSSWEAARRGWRRWNARSERRRWRVNAQWRSRRGAAPRRRRWGASSRSCARSPSMRYRCGALAAVAHHARL